MKDGKPPYRLKPWSVLCGPRNLKGHSIYHGLLYRNVYVIIAALFTIIVLMNPGSISLWPGSSHTSSVHGESGGGHSARASSRKSLIGSSKWSPDSLSLGPRVHNLDGRRQSWWEANSEYRKARPKVLLVTGSEPNPCAHSIETHMLVKAGKNKVHFARKHDFQMHYSLLEPASAFSGSGWAKLAVLRMLIVAHPEVEWFWWMDATTVVTDMDFKVPLEKYMNHNLVIFGEEHLVYDLKDWEGLLTGNFLIRNRQWSIDFLDAWGSMGLASSRQKNGDFLTQSLRARPEGMDADDQSALVYLLATKKKVWGSEVYLENDIPFSGTWADLYSNLAAIDAHSMKTESFRPATTTLFTGCFRCVGTINTDNYVWERCKHAMEHALDFADNQIYKEFGYEIRELGVPRLDPIPGVVIKDVIPSSQPQLAEEYYGFPIPELPGPRVTNWDAQRQEWFRKNPKVTKTNELGLPKTMIVTGSSIKACPQSQGAHFLLQSLKNKMDYARFHDMQMFYGMVDLEPAMDFWWTKIPHVRVLMLANPDVEWFWWCDGDAVITDMVFDPPFDDFKDQNLILYGEDELVYAQNDWIGLNAGVYLIRNCQWTLDLFDVWASLGMADIRVQSGHFLTEKLRNRPTISADDQSALVYILIHDEEKRWSPHVRLEATISLSGNWRLAGPRFEHMKLTAQPGTGTFDWPWITHFAGCQPCGSVEAAFEADVCNEQIRRAHNFADDQVLSLYGLEHSGLGNPQVRNLKPRSVSR